MFPRLVWIKSHILQPRLIKNKQSFRFEVKIISLKMYQNKKPILALNKQRRAASVYLL